jgi:hypothetical protein
MLIAFCRIEYITNLDIKKVYDAYLLKFFPFSFDQTSSICHKRFSLKH